ncbi:MAG: hypothetical protein GXO37_01240 [Chloroflexi bacterium]|nr:hypothetical protein [Chloroflexota bacterium]
MSELPLHPLPPEFQFFFDDPNDPKRPPDEVEVRELRAEVLEHRRVRVYLVLSPYEQRPHIELDILNAADEVVGHLSIVEPVNPRLDFVLYLREEAPQGRYRVVASVQYPPPDFKFRLPEGDEPVELTLPEMREVARAETAFSIGA